MSIGDGFRALGRGFSSVFNPPPLDYELLQRRIDRQLETYMTPGCSSWYGHQFVYAAGQITCTNCGYNTPTKHLKTRVHVCTSWNGHLYALLPADAVEGNLRYRYCTICLSIYASDR